MKQASRWVGMCFKASRRAAGQRECPQNAHKFQFNPSFTNTELSMLAILGDIQLCLIIGLFCVPLAITQNMFQVTGVH